MAADYYIAVNEESKGPYSKAQLKSMWDNGLITSDAQYWTEGLNDWYLASTLFEEDEKAVCSAPSVRKDENILTVSIDLSSVRRKKLYKLDVLAEFYAILSFADNGNIRTYRIVSEEVKQNVIKILRKKLSRSIEIDERIPAKLPPELPLQNPQCPRCCSCHMYGRNKITGEVTGGLIGWLFGGFFGGVAGAALGASRHTIWVCGECGYELTLG